MKQTLESLLELQGLELRTGRRSAKDDARIDALRESAPAQVLAHYDRLIARGKRAVSLAQNGVCGECHLRIPSGTFSRLGLATELCICTNCGRYLYSPALVTPFVDVPVLRVPVRASASEPAIVHVP